MASSRKPAIAEFHAVKATWAARGHNTVFCVSLHYLQIEEMGVHNQSTLQKNLHTTLTKCKYTPLIEKQTAHQLKMLQKCFPLTITSGLPSFRFNNPLSRRKCCPSTKSSWKQAHNISDCKTGRSAVCSMLLAPEHIIQADYLKATCWRVFIIGCNEGFLNVWICKDIFFFYCHLMQLQCH